MLIDAKNNALILKLSEPGTVLDAIPSAKLLNFKGVDLTIVPHGLDEVRVLRNLGISAPSPILSNYKWPGRYDPYEHQKLTSAFLTMNKKALVLNDLGCVDADTEYLSPTGWKRIADYSGGMVAQYHPDTGVAEFVEPSSYVKKPCSSMIRLKTKYGVDQLLSPEHRVLYVGSTNKIDVISAQQVLEAHRANATGWRGRIIATFTCGREGIAISDAALRVQVAAMADGYLPPAIRTNRCVVRLKKQRKKDRLRQLLADANISWEESSKDYKSAVGFTVFTFQIPIRTKSYGDFAWAATNEQLRVITNEVVHWDGSHRKAGAKEFFTNDKASADFVQYAFAATGNTATVSATERRGAVEYVVHARSTSTPLCVSGNKQDGTKSETVYEEPSTDGFKYCFMVPSTFLILRRNGCIFATGNTGKTHSTLWAMDYLMSVGEIKRVLVISPLSTLERVWAEGIFISFTKRKAVVLHGTAKRRRELLKTDADIFIINHDGFNIIADEAIGMFDLVIVDEAAVLRNPTTTRFKTLRKFMAANPDTKLWMLTGTPTPNEPTDAWALAKLVDSPGLAALSSTYTGFRDKVMMKIGQWKFLPRPNSADIVSNVLQPSIRFMRDECVELPETVLHTREVKLTKEQTEVYKDMMKNLVAEASTGQITAANEAVKMQKLIQISCGVAYDNQGNTVELDCGPRIELVKEIIDEAGGKVIVFVPLTGALHKLNRELSQLYTTAVVNGSVPARERNEIFRAFQQDPDPRVIVAHPACMAHGLTLTSASTIIWYGPIASNEQYTQANGRIERIGKKFSSNVFHIEATDLERRIYDRLRNKQKLQGVLLDMIGAM